MFNVACTVKDPIEYGRSRFSIFGNVDKIVLNGVPVPDYMRAITFGKIAKGFIRIKSFGISRINGKCTLYVAAE